MIRETSSAGKPTVSRTITRVTNPAWGIPAAPILAAVAVMLMATMFPNVRGSSEKYEYYKVWLENNFLKWTDLLIVRWKLRLQPRIMPFRPYWLWLQLVARNVTPEDPRGFSPPNIASLPVVWPSWTMFQMLSQLLGPYFPRIVPDSCGWKGRTAAAESRTRGKLCLRQRQQSRGQACWTPPRGRPSRAAWLWWGRELQLGRACTVQ